jgi:PAS domain S-box-containing protein
VEWTRWECRPWYEADGNIGGIIVYTEIITQQVEYEEKLRESLEFQRALIAASPVAILSLSPDGLVKSWNQAAKKIFGWTEKEVVGRFLPIVSEDQKQSFEEFKDRVVSGRSFSGVELIRYRKDGAPVEISLSTAPVRDNQGKVSAIVSIIEDITERKHAEKERDRLQARLIQAGKMESVGRLAGGIAHDFNNMLSF